MKSIRKVSRRLVTVALTVAVLFTAGVSPAPAEEERPSADLSLATLTQYVWRGQELSRNSIVLQPSLTVGYKGFSANVWANLDTDPYATTPGIAYSSTWTETDLTLGYRRSFGTVTAGAGYIYYGLSAPNKDAAAPLDSQEVYLSLGLDTLLSPTLTVYKEIDHYHQWYFLLGVSHSFALSKIVSLNLAASASYLQSEDAGTYPRYDDLASATGDKYGDFHDGVLTASLPIGAAEYVTLTPTLSYVFPLGDAAKNEMKGRGLKSPLNPAENDSSFLYGGLTLDFAF